MSLVFISKSLCASAKKSLRRLFNLSVLLLQSLHSEVSASAGFIGQTCLCLLTCLFFIVKRENNNRGKLPYEGYMTGDVICSVLSAAHSEQSP